MYSQLIALALTAALFPGVVLGEVATPRLPLKDRIYVTQNSAFYEAAAADCKAQGGALATFLPSELSELNTFLSGQAIYAAWVGAEITQTDPRCTRRQLFDASCWVWRGTGTPRPVESPLNTPVWSKDISSKYQTRMSRALYDVYQLGLDIQDNTRPERAVCEYQSPVPPCQCPPPPRLCRCPE